MSDIIATIQLRADTSAQWTLHNPTLKSNELGIETDTFTSSGGVKLYKIKLGDGATAWNSLAYGNIGQFFASGGSGSASWGDITGTISNQTDLQTALSAKANAPDLSTETTARIAGDASTLFSANTYTDSAVSGKENSSNKSTDVNTDQASNVKFPSVKAVYDWTVGLFVQKNANITGATKTKIAYDAKGLVTSGADATTADIADSTNKRYVTDAQLTIIGNTSGTNTGNETAATIGTITNAATNYATPLDADKIGIWDTVNSLFKAVTWANIKATLKTYFDTIYTRAALGIQSGQVIVTSGTSFTTPANITTSTAWEIIGVGGGGGGGSSTTAGASSGGGGGGGVFILHITGLSPSTTYTCAIGQGGAGGTGPGNGNAGTATTLTIGATTYTANGGGLGPGGASATGGAGGTATGGTINFTGQNGADSPTASVASTGGQGGDSALCYGSGGASVKTGVAGNNGSGYGAGGGASKANATGGNGTNGIIIAKYTN